MIQRPVKTTQNDLADRISSFLASPPEGTPAEIIEAFSPIGGKNYLPPKLFLETVEQAPVAISITDPDAHILYVNSAFEQLTGYTRDEVIGKNESVLSSRSTPASVYRDLWLTIQGKRVWQGMLINHRKDKTEYIAELTISPVNDKQGKTAYFLGMHRDVTEVHQLQQQLKYQKNITEAALNAAPMVVAMVATDGKVLMDNHAYKALMGDFRGVEPAAVFLEALEQQIGFDLGKVCQVGQGFTNVEIRLDPPGSSAHPRWFACSGVHVPELDEAAQHYFKQPENARCCLLLIANEVTGSRNRIQEARLNMIRATMAEQQMVQTMREAISGAIFKMQVPLNVIKAALAMPGSDEQNGLVRVLQQALQSGDEAVESLHAALPSPVVEQTTLVNVNELLHEVIRMSTHALLSAGIVVDWRPAPVLPCVSGRVNALRGLFKYIIDNAIKAVIEAKHTYREIRLETYLDGQDLVTAIMDNGLGVPNTHRLKVFEPFFCGWEHPKEHAGMGLTMAQEIIIGHGGSVEIDPDFFGGCRVFIRLPLSGVEDHG